MPKGIRVNAVARKSKQLTVFLTAANTSNFSAGPVYTPLQPASRTGEQMAGWGIGDIPLHGRVAQPAEMGKDELKFRNGHIFTLHRNRSLVHLPGKR